jgi:threonine/homoserine/homoserine lactone efflux protein
MDLFRAFIYGLMVALAVGPIALLIVHRGLAYGRRRAVLTGIGAALGDFFYAGIAFSVGASLSGWIENGFHLRWPANALLAFIGIRIALGGIKVLRHGFLPNPAETSGSRDILSTFFLTVANPLTVLVFVGFLGQINPADSLLGALGLSLSLFLGSLLVQMVLALASSFFHRLLNTPCAIGSLNAISGLGLLAFGIAEFLG